MDSELHQKESLITELKTVLGGYHCMRSKYEAVLQDLEALEREKVRSHTGIIVGLCF
jgi:metal-dependent hydrolase (beta-lactamase superfamily II)